MYEAQINKKKIKNHFQYDKWKYFACVLLVVFSWSLLSTVTAPRTPADKKVDIFLVGGYMMEDEAAEYSQTILADFPELMEINLFNILLEGDMEYVGRQKLMVMVGSQSGDIYSFTEDEFETMVETGLFLPLDDYPELLSYFTEEELEEGTFTTEEDPTPRIYGLPISSIDSIGDSFYNTEDSLIGVAVYSQNTEKALEVIQWMFDYKEKPQYEQRKLEQQKIQEQRELQK